MTSDQVKKLAATPESDVLEFKSSCPRVESLSALLAAFANTRGGTILLGVSDDGAILGVDNAHEALGFVQKASRGISPAISVDVREVPVDGKSIIAAIVEKGPSPPYIVAGKAYQRIGDRTISIGSTDIPDLQGSAYQAVLGGGSAIAKGVGAIAAMERGVAIGGNVRTSSIMTGSVSDSVISYDRAFERVAGSTAFVTDQLELNYRQTREQSQGWYRMSAFAAGGGFLIVLAGVVAVLVGQVTAGVITSIAGLIPEVVAALFFVQGKDANRRVDEIQQTLGDARELLTALEIANTISKEDERNEMKKSIVLKALGLAPNPGLHTGRDGAERNPRQ